MSYSIVDIFEQKTQFKLGDYLSRISSFVERSYPILVEFYSIQKNIDFNIKGIVLELNELYNETETLLSIIQNNSKSLDSRFWDLVEMIDEIKLSLDYIRNTPKWLRSTVSKGKYSYSFENVEILKQRETLENLSLRLGSSNKENEWAYIALRNDLREEDYTPDGGIGLVIQYFNRLALTLTTVVDSNIVGEKVYGKDFNKKINFIDGEGLEVLDYKDTVRQAVDILTKLKVGDNPEFPQDGIPSSKAAGSNRNSFPTQIITRQIQQTFQKDDTLKSLLIKNIEVRSDSIFVDLQVETRINEVI